MASSRILTRTLLVITLFAVLFSCGKPAQVKFELPRILVYGEVDSVINRARDSLVAFDLYADWCAPCRQLEPVIERVAAAYKGKVAFYRVNTDQVPEVMQKFGGTAIPHVVFVKNKTVLASIVGIEPEEAYTSVIRQYYASTPAVSADTAKKK